MIQKRLNLELPGKLLYVKLTDPGLGNDFEGKNESSVNVADQVDLARSALIQVPQYLEYRSSVLRVELDIFVAGNVYGLGKT